VISDFIQKNEFGISVLSLKELNKNHQQLLNYLISLESKILKENKNYTYEAQIDKMHLFYNDVIRQYHLKKIEKLKA
jgi:hypothetical protein